MSPPKSKGRTLHVVLVHPEIPWNTGNIGRTCLAIGARLHLVAPLGFSLQAAEVQRAGLDYWSRVRPQLWSDWQSLESAMPRLGEPIFFSPDAAQLYWDVSYPPSTVLVFGSETDGLPGDLRRRFADRMVRIPQAPDTVRSLNLSTCVGIVAFEVLRQRR